MKEKKIRLCIDEYERRLILNSLILMRNEVIANGGYGDCVNELIAKVADAPQSKFGF